MHGWARVPRRRASTQANGGDHANARPGLQLSSPLANAGEAFPSETRVKTGDRVVHGDKELLEKLGRQDPCPCGSGRRFKACCIAARSFQGPEALQA
ncbi:SEC-C metal-binding domain-containing protein [Brevundimonas sp.]|uniref:SEC-C metal-binding domain-containing protein n=1 Tax=Brevundimonas sp. TaxID=1871086 RepID=UPI00343F2A74